MELEPLVRLIFGIVLTAVSTAVGTLFWKVYSMGERVSKLEADGDAWATDRHNLEALLNLKHEALRELISTKFDHTNQRLERMERSMAAASSKNSD